LDPDEIWPNLQDSSSGKYVLMTAMMSLNTENYCYLVSAHALSAQHLCIAASSASSWSMYIHSCWCRFVL